MRMNYFKLKFLLLFFALAVAIPPAWAETVKDELTLSTFGVTGTDYTDVSGKKATSDAVYAGNLAGGNDAIQLRTDKSTSGIITTTSGGKVKSITITFNSHTADGRSVIVFGKSSAYTAASELYNTNTRGKSIGALNIDDGTTGTITIPEGEEYSYIGIKSNKNAIYLDKIEIVWETEGGSTTEKVATPTFSVKEGTYTEAQSVEISCATDDATIYYTIDGTDPTAESTPYTGAAISISKTTTIKAIAMKDGMDNSTIAFATYTINVPAEERTYNKVTDASQLIAGKKYILVYEDTPAFLGGISTTSTKYGLSITGPALDDNSVNIGQYSDIRELTLSGDASGWSFHNGDGYLTWTSGNSLNVADEITNNAKWTVSSIEDGFILTNVDNTDRVLKYNKTSGQQRFACYTQGQESAVLYVEDGVEPSVLPTVATPTFTPAAGTYTEVQNVEINCTTEDATIYYTTDGTVPTTASAVYSTAIEVAQNMTIKAIAMKEGMTNSEIATATYTINIPSGEGKTFVKVTAADQLVAGKKYIIVHEDVFDCDILGGISTTSTKYGLPITGPEIEDNSIDISNTEGVREFTLVGNNTGWSFQYENTYLTWTSGNSLNVATEISDNAKWTVDDNFSLLNVADNSRKLQFNKDRFACYTSVQQSAVLYVEDGVEPSVLPTVATPTFEPAPQEEAFTTVQNVTISCATAGATIYYTTDGSEPTAESAVYSEPIVVNDGTTTIKAIAMKEGMTNSEVASATYTVNLPTLDAPTFDHESKIYDDAFEVAITAAEDATIYYTTDGTDPTAESAVYKDRIPVNKNMTIKAIAVKEGYKTSAVATAEYQIKVAKPTFSPVPGTFDAATQVSIVCGTEDATIHYTTDGTDPNAESPVYSQPIAVNSGTMTIKAIAIKEDMTNSDIAEGVYTIKQNAGLAFDPTTATAEAGAEEFTAPTLVNPNNLSPITYKSSDENVAAFVDGVLVIGDAGETTITATFAGNEEFNEGSASYTLTVTKKDAGLKYEQAELTVYAGNDFTAPTLVNPNKLSPITYSSDNENVAMVDDKTGEVVLMDEIGDAKITATFAGNGQYNEATASYTIHVIAKKTATLSFDVEGITVYPNAEDFTQPKLTTTPENLTVTYTSTDDNIATVVNGVLMIGDKIGKATITATFAGNDEYAKAEASYTVTVEPRPIVVADEDVEFELYVGQTGTETFTVMAQNLKGDITLTLNDKTGFYRIEPTTIDMDDAENATVTVTYAPTTEGFHEATVTLSTKDAEEDATVTLTGMAEVQPVVAMPTFSLVAGTYGKAQQLIISAESGATILYSTDGSEPTTKYTGAAIDLGQGTTTVKAVATKDGSAKSPVVTATYIIDIPKELPTITPFKGYYQIKNNGNGMYANIAGRKTLNFTDAPADKAGTVIWLETNDKGQVQSIRSQAADLQGYANRAMHYVPKMVDIVVNKINQMEGIEDATGAGSVLGENGLEEIMAKFNECFDYHLYVEEQAGEGWRLYGKTPNMQHVVDFYRDHKDQVEAKLPKLEDFINDALDKLKAKIGGDSVFTEFKLLDIWQKMGGTLTKPTDDASTMAFYREVLNNKNYVWDFAYQTAQIYWGNVKKHPRYKELKAELGEYADYIDEFVTQVRPDFKYYVIQRGNEPDYISEGNGEIISNQPYTIWTLEPRTDFTVNIAGEQFGYGLGGYATTNYTDFAYTVPEGVTAYKVASVENGVAKLEALSGVIPAQTPVLLIAKEAGDYVLTLSTEAGTTVSDNLLVGPDYLIKTYELKTPMVEQLFVLAKGVLGEQLYNQYVAEYEYLQLLYAGTVNNKYFWGLSQDNVKKCVYTNEENTEDCVIRNLVNGEFVNDWKSPDTNKAFLVSETDQTIKLSWLRGDINKDGVISITDVTALIDILLDWPDTHYQEPTDTYPKGLDYEAADVNEEKEGIEITDVTTLIDILLNMPDQPAQGSGN